MTKSGGGGTNSLLAHTFENAGHVLLRHWFQYTSNQNQFHVALPHVLIDSSVKGRLNDFTSR